MAGKIIGLNDDVSLIPEFEGLGRFYAGKRRLPKEDGAALIKILREIFANRTFWLNISSLGLSKARLPRSVLISSVSVSCVCEKKRPEKSVQMAGLRQSLSGADKLFIYAPGLFSR